VTPSNDIPLPLEDSGLSSAGRTIAVGDIHGCLAALQGLLNQIGPGPTDWLIVLGDVINRGPDSRDVIDRLLQLRRECRLTVLLGNHELALLDAGLERWHERCPDADFPLDEFGNDERAAAWEPCREMGGEATLRSYGWPRPASVMPAAHVGLICECRLYVETETHIFVHAGVAPNLPMEHQAASDLLWQPVDSAHATPHYSGKTVICGHSHQADRRVLDLKFLQCIDTGCGTGGCLTALDAVRGTIWQADENGRRLNPAPPRTTAATETDDNRDDKRHPAT